MKRGLIFLLLINCFASAAQSRKKQIESLSYSIDSLDRVIELERISTQQKVAEFEIKASNLNSEMSRLWNDIKELNQANITLKKEIMLMEEEKNKQSELIESKIKQSEETILLIAVKTDSLNLISKELAITKSIAVEKPNSNKNNSNKNNSNKNNSNKNNSNSKFRTVQIGEQIWMSENLNVTTFRNGDPILEVKTMNEWKNAIKEKKPAFSRYPDLFDNISYEQDKEDEIFKLPEGFVEDNKTGKKYGKFYNWYAVNDSRGLAPEGWRIPSDSDWTALVNYLGGTFLAGPKLKQKEIITKTKIKKTRKVGGYYESKYIPCSHCSYWTEKQRENNPCTVCHNKKGTIVKTGKYIPEKTEIYYEEIENKSGWNGTNESGFSALPFHKDDCCIGIVEFWATYTQNDKDLWCSDGCPLVFSITDPLTSQGPWISNVNLYYKGSDGDPPDQTEVEAKKKYNLEMEQSFINEFLYVPVRCVKN